MDKIFAILKSLEQFSSLSDEELNLLVTFSQLMIYEKNDFILREGDPGDKLYFIIDGKAEVIKGDVKKEVNEQIAILEKGAICGDVSFIDREKLSASIKANTKSEVLVINLRAFYDSSKNSSLPAKITKILAKNLSKQLRITNEGLIDRLTLKLEITRIILSIFVMIAIYIVVFKAISIYPPDSIIVMITSSAMLLAGVCFLIYWIVKSRLPLSFYGFTLKNWKHNTIESILWSIPALIIAVIIKYLKILFTPALQNFKIIDILPRTNEEIIAYLILVPIQEILFRGFFQSIFTSLFRGPRKVLAAIAISNGIFYIFHNVKSFELSIFVFFYGSFWGILYARQKSLLGPTISHLIIGGIMFFLLNMEGILRF